MKTKKCQHRRRERTSAVTNSTDFILYIIIYDDISILGKKICTLTFQEKSKYDL